MAINTVTDLRNTDPGQTAFTVRQSPVGGKTSCHAVQVTQGATSGDGAGLNVVSNNTGAPAIRTRAAGPLIQLYDASNNLKFSVANDGTTTAPALSVSGALTVASLTTTGNASVGGTLGATGAATLSSTLNVSGYTTLAGGQANSDWAVFGNISAFGTNKAYRFRTNGSNLDLEATGTDLIISNWSGTAFNGTQRSYLRMSADAQNIQMAGKIEFVDALYGATKHVLDGAANSIGFFGTAATTKQTVSGAKGGNAALASLLTALAAYGLVTDSTTA